MSENNAIELKHVTKRFGEVIANDRVNLTLRKGEILSILGENGSGKTTLMNMLSGIYFPDEGEIFVNGTEVTIRSPKDSFDLGIGMFVSCLRTYFGADCVNTPLTRLCQTIAPPKYRESGLLLSDCLKLKFIIRIYPGNPRIGCDRASCRPLPDFRDFSRRFAGWESLAGESGSGVSTMLHFGAQADLRRSNGSLLKREIASCL